ncbi:peptidase M48, Ste24p [Paramagnetospirillum caucaseum]|uniref:Peptidase M48, Ste24p n=1 Tax=Paramagnetospirillum caucaseum TaxID=1244869 RepID=M2YD19_9PROT|nr:M48 family metallopeptidase [Paramagnetospirillum caucaseum]EME70896.1 peptidase M48, Ste24p [Paramagnetospirillum caucaseum]
MNGLEADRPGRFSDGRSAAARKVVVRVLATGLEIRGSDGFLIAVWKAGDLLADGDWPEKRGVRLRCASEPDARLAVEDAYVIREVLPQPAKPPSRRRLALVLGCLLGAGMLAGLMLALAPVSKLLAHLVPAGLERQWGESIAGGLAGQMKACDGRDGMRVLDALARRLAEPLPADRRHVNIHVLQSRDVNALALPGGEIILFSGLIAKAEGPDELAGVLAHELTHIGERHVTAAMIRALGVGVLATMITGDASGLVAGGVGAVLAGTYSREDESAADSGALALLEMAGIGSDGLARFFRRLETMEGRPGQVLAWLGTHPEAGRRAAAVEARRGAAPRLPALSEADWLAVKRVCSKPKP